VRFCDVGSSRSAAHEDPTSRLSILHQASEGYVGQAAFVNYGAPWGRV
jgi:hypothetical protein